MNLTNNYIDANFAYEQIATKININEEKRKNYIYQICLNSHVTYVALNELKLSDEEIEVLWLSLIKDGFTRRYNLKFSQKIRKSVLSKIINNPLARYNFYLRDNPTLKETLYIVDQILKEQDSYFGEFIYHRTLFPIIKEKLEPLVLAKKLEN